MSDLRYPIGKFQWTAPANEEDAASARTAYINTIAGLPEQLSVAVTDLRPDQLDTPYRPEGWTVRQVVHHVPDSHLNAYIRFKMALTEDAPTIKPYMEDRWAELREAKQAPVEVSLALLDSLHQRWVMSLRNLSETDWKRTFLHPDLGTVTLEKSLALYAWHGRHHVAHVAKLRERMGW